jgi:iron complex transport system ATP-binding protein
MIEVQHVSFAVNKKILVNEVSLFVEPGEFVVIMGPNGAGKSTLLKMMSGALPPTKGKILLKGKDLATYKTDQLAKQRAVLSQHYEISFPLSAREIVMMGRYPYFNSFPRAEDEAIVTNRMERMQVTDLGDRSYQTLSGGEAQKVQMSRVLAQIGDTGENEQKLLLLDEPVSHLDVKYQHQLLAVAKECCKKQVAVIAVLHDINLAIKYADRILFMKQASVIKNLAKHEPLTSELLESIFDIKCRIIDLPEGGKFVVF